MDAEVTLFSKPEELIEMRSAFGAGETIVDVITGDVITL